MQNTIIVFVCLVAVLALNIIPKIGYIKGFILKSRGPAKGLPYMIVISLVNLVYLALGYMVVFGAVDYIFVNIHDISFISIAGTMILAFGIAVSFNCVMFICYIGLFRFFSKILLDDKNNWPKLIDLIYYPASIALITLAVISLQVDLSELKELQILASISIIFLSMKMLKPIFESWKTFNRLTGPVRLILE